MSSPLPSTSPFSRPPELLAPAGDWECVRAAVANGADAIYFGLPAFNARMRATNFTPEDLPRLMDYLHGHGVRGFAAFNTLIFTSELADAEAQLRLVAQSGVDAIIVQDLGLVRLAREIVPGLELHASTQMTLTSPEGISFAQRQGIARAVLARELSLRELAKFDPVGLPLEVFVHGALCVAYSGQCLTSEALGQRSANRGECAQACRLPYELVVDGERRDLGDRRYLLSPQDLAAVEEIPELIRLGIVSFKIEGRLKTPEYVASVTQVYRRAIDRAWEAREKQPMAPAAPAQASSGEDRYRLEMAFSRGLYSGWMHGVNHQRLVHARFGKKRGALIGRITAVGRTFLEVKQEVPVRPGDGVVIDAGLDTDQEQGGRVYQATVTPSGVTRLEFEHGKINFAKVGIGHRLWKTDDPKLNRELRQSWAQEKPRLRQTLDLTVAGTLGAPLRLSGQLGVVTASVESHLPLQLAEKRPLTTETLRAQLGRLGDTGLTLGTLENRLEGNLILPLSELNRLRRELVVQLESAAPPPPGPSTAEPFAPSTVENRLRTIRVQPSPAIERPFVTVLCRTLAQIETALRLGVEEIYADFEDIRRYAEAVALVRDQLPPSGAKRSQILLATPRIQKAGEAGFFRLIENAAPDGVLIRNLGALDFFRHSSLRRVGDFSLNIANPLTAELLWREGLGRLTVSYDLNGQQVLDLLRHAPASWFEITLHQHIPMFHMEHCVFAAFLSEGTDHTNCGRPCDHHQVEMRDRVGLLHPLKADVGCRNTLFHAQAQSGAACFEAFLAEKPAAFRIELLLEDGPQAEHLIRGYQRLLSGDVTGTGLVRELNLRSQLGVTTGLVTAS